jgi:hypothetical protein
MSVTRPDMDNFSTYDPYSKDRVNTSSANQMGMNQMGMNQMGMNQMGMNQMGMNQMGMNYGFPWCYLYKVSMIKLAYFLGCAVIFVSVILLIIYANNNDECLYHTGLGMFFGGIAWLFVVYAAYSMKRDRHEVGMNHNLRL